MEAINSIAERSIMSCKEKLLVLLGVNYTYNNYIMWDYTQKQFWQQVFHRRYMVLL